MLKTRRGAEFWLVTQPDHAALAGLLAAHWGNAEFARPGAFAASPDEERVRREVVLAVAEHDNGWWEWEADPELSVDDGLPQGLSEVPRDPISGMQRWRLGVPRLAARHPYASLLIGDHAQWLYTAQFEAGHPAELTHPLQRGRSAYPRELEPAARRFIAEMREMQEGFRWRMAQDALWQSALEPGHRLPHARLVQILDALSLALCSDVILPAGGGASGLGRDALEFADVPRGEWGDRVTMRLRPISEGRIAVEPYPFAEPELRVAVAARVAAAGADWRAAERRLMSFTFVRA